jgi:hypothetical protein
VQTLLELVKEADRALGRAIGANFYHRTIPAAVDTECAGAIRQPSTETGFRAARSTYWFASGAHTVHALLALIAAVEAAATVALASLQVDAVAVAAGLVRSASVATAATVALVSLKRLV